MALQQQLNGAGASIAVDGIFGAGTRAAVATFQKSAGLIADGIAGPKTWQALQGGSASASSAPAERVDPRQAALVAKLAQVRVALNGAAAKSGGAGPVSSATASGEKTQARAHIGGPVPACGIPVPDGSKPAPWAFESSTGIAQRDLLDDAASWVDDTASSVSEAAGEAYNDASEAAGSAATWVDDQVSGAAEKVGEWVDDGMTAASEAAEWVGSTASNVAESAGEAFQSAKESVQEVVGEVQGAVNSGIDVVVQTASGIAKDVGEFGEDLQKRFAKEIAIVKQVADDLLNGLPDIPGMLKKLDDILAGIVGGGGSQSWFGIGEPELDPPAKLYANFDVASTVTRGGVKVPGGTGYSEPKFSIAPVSWWKVVDDAIMIDAKLNIDCHWEIASEGRGTSITSANDPAVTEVSYLTIINDLDQLSQSYKTGGGVATTYWSEPIVERHELFHCRDFIGEATRYLPEAKAWLETQQVDQGMGNKVTVDPQIDKAIATMRQKIEDDGRKYFDDGGEQRAYDDGKGTYDALINQIKARAKKEKWKGSKDL